MELIPYGKAICYSGYREGQSPVTEVPTKEQIEEDLDILNEAGYRYLRMYDPNLHARRVLEIIREKKLPMKCIIGIDSFPEINHKESIGGEQNFSEEVLKKNAERNDGELEKLIEMVKEYDDEVLAVSIGNENTPDWTEHGVTEDRLIRHADRLKECLTKPVTLCEGYFEWKALKNLATHLDFISVHSYPYHYGNKVDVAVEENKRHLKEVQEMYPDKQVIFTEVGWSAHDTDPADETGWQRATLEHQIQYITELEEWLEKDQIIGFVFEAFNEPWKATSTDKSECNFGLWDVNRKKKW